MSVAPPIDIETEFPRAVRRAGGEVVEDLLDTRSPAVANADYLFRFDGVVAELKCLDKNVVADPDFAAKLGRLYDQLMKEGRAPLVFGRVRVSVADIAKYDERAAHEFLEPYRQRLGKVLKKANSQLKETAAHFGIARPKGLLLLANDGDLGYEFDLVLYLLNRLLQDRYGSINTILYFTANLTVEVPEFQPARIWAPLESPGRPMIGDELLGRLTTAWMERVATLTGGPVLAKVVEPGDMVDAAGVRLTDGARPRIRLRGI